MTAEGVVIVTPDWGRTGGVASHVVDSAEALRSHGVPVRVLVGRATNETPDFVRVVPGIEGARIDPSVAREVLDELKSTCAVAHIHDLQDNRFVEALGRGHPTIVSAHGYPGCSPNTYYFSPGHECSRPQGPLCIAHMAFHGCLHSRRVDKILPLYRATSERMAAFRSAVQAVAYSSSVERNLIANRIPVERVPMTTPVPAASSPPPEEPRVLFVGRVVAAKGLPVLIEAMRGVDAPLEIVGDGWQLPHARALAAELGVALDHRGWLEGEGLDAAYARASVVALPSVWPEPFGLVGLEAHIRGRPVVASRTGGITDWLDDEESGLLVDPGDPVALRDALVRLLSDRRLAADMGEVGRIRTSERFNDSRHAAALAESYHRAPGAFESRA